ncbi:MAG: hypothetical protein Q4A78_01200 [Peptostreptococcaceae bacterium]|nr:hypothetical protein [Peptostreptococcaceae bacterium]
MKTLINDFEEFNIRKKKLSFLLVFVILFFLVSCNRSTGNREQDNKDDLSAVSNKENIDRDDGTFREEEMLETHFSESNTYSFSELELYKETGVDKEKYEIRILDSDKNSIFFTIDAKRDDKRLAEGILSKTEELCVYKVNEKSFDVIREFGGYYITQGYLACDKYIALGIQLSEKDTNYSVFYGDKGRLNEIYKGENTWHFSMWPSLVKLDTGIVLFEPQIESGGRDDIITGVELLRLQNAALEKTDLQIPDDFALLSSETKSDRGSFVTFWENKKEQRAYFVLVDEKGIQKTTPLPKKYRLMTFTLSENKVIAIVELGHEKRYKILVFDMDSGLLYANNFPYVTQMLSLSSGGKIIIRSDDHGIYVLEFENNELYLKKANVKGIDKSLLSRKILFTEFGDKVILTVYDKPKRFIVLEIK